MVTALVYGAIRVHAQAENIVLCSWARFFILKVPLSA